MIQNSRTANSGNLTSKVKADEMSARVETGVHIPIDYGAYITPLLELNIIS